MSEIARRVGGSKATLYGYFPSKENLFLAVVEAEGQRHMAAAEAEVMSAIAGTLRDALIRLGEAVVTFMCSEVACSAHRMVLGAAGRSDIGQAFYEMGPKPALERVAVALSAAMDRNEIRRADPWVAAQHLSGLLTAEIQPRWFCRDLQALAPGEAQAIAERAVDVFSRGYSI
ncbi:TetR family transcriptional regulator [Sphaerotilus hippei]|uniref:TetR family transcriptional regulator n=2 Tax=Sphaerotilus hippei TaxID=744406 RepID=A0A318GVN5_9BURK|nr:TetR family transcriptional regulator [Sphaerotilus hippei]